MDQEFNSFQLALCIGLVVAAALDILVTQETEE